MRILECAARPPERRLQHRLPRQFDFHARNDTKPMKRIAIRFIGRRGNCSRRFCGLTVSARRAAFRSGQVPRKRHTRQGASDGCADGDESDRIHPRHQNHPRPLPSHQPTAAKIFNRNPLIRSQSQPRYFHAAGRRMKLPCVPTGIASGSWQRAGKSRGMFL